MGCKEGNKSPTHEHTDGNAARSGVTTKIQSGGPRQSKTNSGSIRPESELLDDLNRFGKQHIPRNEQWERYLETIRDLAKINPQAALDHLGSLGENDPAAADAGYIEVFKIVSACNPRFIETWLMNDWSKLKPGNLKDCCIYDAVFQLGQNAPSIGLGIINNTSFPGNGNSVRDGFFKAFAVSDPNGAFAAA